MDINMYGPKVAMINGLSEITGQYRSGAMKKIFFLHIWQVTTGLWAYLWIISTNGQV